MRKTMKRGLVTALVLALVAVPTAAFADEAPTRDGTDAVTDEARERPHDRLEDLKERAVATITKQIEVLEGLKGKIAGSRHITPGHAGRLLGDINGTIGRLQALARQIEDASTLEELRPLIEAIPAFEVANVMVPKTVQVIASDTLVAVGGKLERFADKLGTVIARFEEAGFDVDEAWRLLAEMKDSAAEGIRLAEPVAESVIGLQPSDWPSPASELLGAGRSNLHAAGENLHTAHRLGGEIVKFLRNLYDSATDAVPSAATTP